MPENNLLPVDKRRFNEILDTLIYCVERWEYPWEEFSENEIHRFVDFVRPLISEVNEDD